MLSLLILSCNNSIKDPIETYVNNQADIIISSSSYETLLADLEQVIHKHDALKLNKHETEFITSIIKESVIDSTIYLSLFKKKDFEFQIVGQYKTKTTDSLLKLNLHNKNLIIHRNDTIWKYSLTILRIISNNSFTLNKMKMKEEIQS